MNGIPSHLALTPISTEGNQLRFRDGISRFCWELRQITPKNLNRFILPNAVLSKCYLKDDFKAHATQKRCRA